MNQAGFIVAAFDLRGHGNSEGQRGHTPSINAYMQDIYVFLSQFTTNYQSLPVFLYGHSLGGVLVLNYGLREQAKLSGVVASGPGLRSAIAEQKLKAALSKVAGSLIPEVLISSGLDLDLVSRDPEVVKKLRDDPLRNDQISLGFGKEMLITIEWTFEHVDQFASPLLLMHGTADQLAYPSGSQEFAAKISGDCTLKLWDGLAHELHNEPEKAQVFEYLIEWLESKMH